MNAVLGTLFLAAAAVLFAGAYSQFRRPQPPAWTARDASAEVATIVFVGLLAFGMGFAARFVMAPERDPLGWTEVLALAGILATAVLLVAASLASLRRARAGRRQSADLAALGLPPTVPAPANDPERPGPATAPSTLRRRWAKRHRAA